MGLGVPKVRNGKNREVVHVYIARQFVIGSTWALLAGLVCIYKTTACQYVTGSGSDGPIKKRPSPCPIPYLKIAVFCVGLLLRSPALVPVGISFPPPPISPLFHRFPLGPPISPHGFRCCFHSIGIAAPCQTGGGDCIQVLTSTYSFFRSRSRGGFFLYRKLESRHNLRVNDLFPASICSARIFQCLQRFGIVCLQRFPFMSTKIRYHVYKDSVSVIGCTKGNILYIVRYEYCPRLVDIDGDILITDR